jgi:hypothetical protein
MSTKLTKKKLLKQQKINQIRIQSYHSKLEEYGKLTLAELKELWDTKKPGGIYRTALIETVRQKQIEEMNMKLKSESSEETVIEELPQDTQEAPEQS